MIQVFKPCMDHEEISAVAEVLRSGWIGLGPKTAEFEREFARFVGVKCCVGLNSCTAALDMALKLLGVRNGDEVIVPTMTFVSTAHVVAYNLAKPIFVDVDESTLSLDIEDVRRKVTVNTKAVIPVHFAGRPVEFDRLVEAVPGIPIIEDAAHAAGALYRGRRCGSLGAIGCFSFHAVKNLAMGDGGAITLNDERYCNRAKRLRWLGIDKGTWDRTEVNKSYWWQYMVGEIGLKCHMNDIAASIGLVQLRKLEALNRRRREIAERYTEGLRDTDGVEVPPADDDAFQSSWHIYHIKCERRDDLHTFLQAEGVLTGVHYKPIHLYRCYGNRPHLPVAERLFERILTLPMYPTLANDEVDLVVEKIQQFYGKASRPGRTGRGRETQCVTPAIS